MAERKNLLHELDVGTTVISSGGCVAAVAEGEFARAALVEFAGRLFQLGDQVAGHHAVDVGLKNSLVVEGRLRRHVFERQFTGRSAKVTDTKVAAHGHVLPSKTPRKRARDAAIDLPTQRPHRGFWKNQN